MAPPAVGLTSKLEPRKGSVKVQLNTWVLASTEARLTWLVNGEFTVTSVVDVALQGVTRPLRRTTGRSRRPDRGAVR
ncbi:hypothetical protein OPAG_08235 [Rhodococcus opacus PD630]|nr:hypothetical protein OPAG_08235 [Rhodococcus opacus PD630]